MLVLSFFYYCTGLLIPEKRSRRLVISVSSKVMFRLILWIMGYRSIPVEVAAVSDTSMEAGEELELGGGDIVIANFGSYIDIFLLQYKYAPLFVIPVDQENVSMSSVYSLFMNMIAGERLNHDSVRPFREVLQISKDSGFPIVVFPEQNVSNGSTILPFSDFTCGTDLSEQRLQIVGVIHRGQGVSPNFVAGNGFFHLIRMIGRTMSSIKVRIVAQNDTPKPVGSSWLEDARAALAAITRISAKSHTD